MQKLIIHYIKILSIILHICVGHIKTNIVVNDYETTEDEADDNKDEDDEMEISQSTLVSDPDELLFGVTTENELDQDNEIWMRNAVLDVAYYLRNHKFNRYDVRYTKLLKKKLNFHKEFPNPPLRALHWNVNKHCDSGFLNCIKYLHSIVKQATLQRRHDTSVLIKRNNWTMPKDSESISVANSECLRLLRTDYEKDYPFQSKLERFQWTVTASYYMCWYSMQEHPHLSLFEEPCDNLANCLQPNKNVEISLDPRSNNYESYQCAIYSFCPDPCCPLITAKNKEECYYSEANPCNQKQSDNKTCILNRNENQDFTSIVLNNWNYSCDCEDDNMTRWNTKFGICLDIDQCKTNEHSCNEGQHCINIKNGHFCVCKQGLVWDSKKMTCINNPLLNEAVFKMNVRNAIPKSILVDEKGFSIIRAVRRYFKATWPGDEEQKILVKSFLL